jgi:hypothetical protein
MRVQATFLALRTINSFLSFCCQNKKRELTVISFDSSRNMRIPERNRPRRRELTANQPLRFSAHHKAMGDILPFTLR